MGKIIYDPVLNKLRWENGQDLSALEESISGRYYGQSTIGPHSTITSVANILVAAPYLILENHFVDQIAIEVTSAVVNGKTRLGLYYNNNGVPGDLIEEAAEVNCSTTGIKSSLFDSPIRLTKGMKKVWMCWTSNDDLISFRSATVINRVSKANDLRLFSELYLSRSYQALPNNFGVATTYSNNTSLLISLKRV